MDTREYEANLAKQFHYQKLDAEFSSQVREYYKLNIPQFLKIEGSRQPLFSKNGSQIAKGYDRIVIGDYGAFIEFSKSDAMKFDYIVESGQEYRMIDPKYKNNVKYDWYTMDDGSHVKIYHQKKRVTYADYQVGKYYVSVHEVARMVLFSHIDLDGVGSRLMVQLIYPDIEIHHVDYNFELDMNNRKIMADADSIIFTDISINRDMAKLLESTRQQGKQLLLLDHHASALENLGDLGYEWIHIDTSQSGALLAYHYFENEIKSKYPNDAANYEVVAKLVSDYDLWEHKYSQSVVLQFYWSKVGNEDFIKRFLQKSSAVFTPEEQSLIKESEDALAESYQIASSNMEWETDSYGRKWILIKSIGLMYSLVASRILKENPDAVYCVVMGKKNNLSFRSTGFDVKSIAEKLGGGGHPQAAGCSIPEGLIDIPSSVNYQEWTEYPFK